jgi:hypothetical protein
LEEDLPNEWPLKTGRSSNSYLGQSRLQTYIDQTLHSNKGEIDQKEITTINLYAPNFIKHTLQDLKAYIISSTVLEGDFNSPLSSIA